ncbi:MarR family winged helix-turn-helix transcriptional regulator [Kineococcus rubinsiae]|uniref:MarR family winged helix-turn-helix transcriptional regulator n=1 Tax=Kineococcus rubinsiae TaxID=2609562 RepID=UPI001AD94EA6|nr:MarR family transcriptional regulator [Kineococcus rubinsiae]
MQSDEALAERLLLACSGLTRAASAATAAGELSLTQARLLGNLDREGPLRISRLAALERCAQPSMTSLVSRCADAGLVTREADPGDARAVRVTLTPAGTQALRENRRRLSGPVGDAVDALGTDRREDVAGAVALLEALVGTLWSHADAPPA